jgi:hypothetical protein
VLLVATSSCAPATGALDYGDAQDGDASNPGDAAQGPSDAGADEVLTFAGADSAETGGCKVCSTDLHQALDFVGGVGSPE